MQRVLLIEDNPRDIYEATSVLQKLGMKDVHAITSVPFAIEYLREISEGRRTPPDLLVLDLDFGKDSGFEVLRYWKSTPQLKDVRVIVWTVMGELERKMCELFGVEAVVPKSAGPRELQRFLRDQRQSGGADAASA